MHARSLRLIGFVLVGLAPAATLMACGASTDDEPENKGGAAGVAGGGAGGSKAGSSPGGASGGGSGGASGAGGNSQSGAAGTGGSAGNSGAGGDGPVACGSKTCSAPQYCVMPCCGGAPPACIYAPSEGRPCPNGTHAGCVGGVGCAAPASCCQYDACTPPDPYCSDTLPVGCLNDGRTCRLTCP